LRAEVDRSLQGGNNLVLRIGVRNLIHGGSRHSADFRAQQRIFAHDVKDQVPEGHLIRRGA
jgi:hypothetical protein